MRADDDVDAELELDGAERELVRKLRGMPAQGGEPDWDALERSIRDAVGPDVPKPWWKRWQFLVPIGALAATAAAALLWLHRPAPEVTAPTAPVAIAPREVAPAPVDVPDPAMAMWLDGKIVDLDDVDPSAILDDDEDREAQSAFATESSGMAGGILPAGDLGWIDNLDDRALDRAEQWLDSKKKG
jgi:hypothetical protein